MTDGTRTQPTKPLNRPDQGLDVVTGAFSYTGRAITAQLLAAGRSVRTLTNHPGRAGSDQEDVRALPLDFDDPVGLARSLEGASTLFCTYWVRFPHGGRTFTGAVENSRTLFGAAREAGVRRIVHVSITNPSLDSPFPYFRGKAEVEEALWEAGVPASVVRPTVVFGGNDVLLNNIAYLARRLPVFAVAGSGAYRVRPVHVEDVARLCLEEAGNSAERAVVDAVGPEGFTFDELVTVITGAVGARTHLLHLPAALLPPLAGVLGLLLRDVLLTRDELGGMMAGLVDTDGPATGRIDLRDWLAGEGRTLGRRYSSELARNYR